MTDRDAVLASITPDELRGLLMENLELFYAAADLLLTPILSKDPETLDAWRTVTANHTERWKSGKWRGGNLIGAFIPTEEVLG